MAYPDSDVRRRIPILAATCVALLRNGAFRPECRCSLQRPRIMTTRMAIPSSPSCWTTTIPRPTILSNFLAITASGTKADSFTVLRHGASRRVRAAANDYKDKNRQNWRVSKKFNLKFGYKLVDLANKRQPLAPTPNAKELSRLPCSTQDLSRSPRSASTPLERTPSPMSPYFAARIAPAAAYHLLVKEKEGWKEFVSSPVCEWMSFNSDSLFDRSPAS